MSLPVCSYFGGDKPPDISHFGQIDHLVQEGCSLNELNGNACLSLHVGDQYSFPTFGSLHLPDHDKNKLKHHEMGMNLQGQTVDYQVNGNNIEIPRPIFDNPHHAWVPGPSQCGIAMFDGNSYNQASFFLYIYY